MTWTNALLRGGRKYTLAMVLCLLVSACLVPGESFIRIRGVIVDANGEPVSPCVVSVIDFDKQATIFEKSTTNEVDLHLVNPPSQGEFVVVFKCTGFNKALQVGAFNFADYSLVNPLQLGQVVIAN